MIIEERLAELTGAPPGGPADAPFAPGGGAGPVVDLAGVLDRLELGSASSTSGHA